MTLYEAHDGPYFVTWDSTSGLPPDINRPGNDPLICIKAQYLECTVVHPEQGAIPVNWHDTETSLWAIRDAVKLARRARGEPPVQTIAVNEVAPVSGASPTPATLPGPG